MKRKTVGLFMLAALAAVLAGCLIMTACGHEHTFGAWKITPATCEKDGSRERVCKECGEKETEVLPAAGHDWEVIDVIKEATCTEQGKELRRCRVCQDEEEFDVDPTGHTWGFVRTLEPTCETAGNDHYTCSECGYYEDRPVAALGHNWKLTRVIQESTCTVPGKNEQTCQRSGCGQTREVNVAALGHNFEGMFTVDKRPSFSAPGEKSYHCTRCSERNQITEIPMLEENTPIDYEFRIMRNNGDLVVNKGAVITVKDQDGNVVKTGTAGETASGIYTAKLLPKTYTVSLSGLPDGFSSEQATVDPFDPYCKLWVTTAPISKPVPSGKKYSAGDVMYDFEITTINNEKVSLSALLREKKGVLINFFYVGCTYCEQEFPGLEAAYKQYQEDIAVIAIDPYAYHHDTEKSVRDYAAGLKLTFYVALDKTLELNKYFGVSGYPTSVFIDGEGAITRIDTGALLDGNSDATGPFSQIFASLVSDSYWKNPAKQTATANAAMPALLPEGDRKQQNL